MLGNACSLCWHWVCPTLPWDTRDHQSISELPHELIVSNFTLIPPSPRAPPNHWLVLYLTQQCPSTASTGKDFSRTGSVCMRELSSYLLKYFHMLWWGSVMHSLFFYRGLIIRSRVMHDNTETCGQNNHAVPFESHADGPNTERQREVRYRVMAKKVIINRNIGHFSSVALKLHVLSCLISHLPSVNSPFSFPSLYTIYQHPCCFLTDPFN